MSPRLTQKLKAPVAPLVRWLRAKAYGARYSLRLKELERAGKREIKPAATIDPHASADALWQRLQDALPAGIHRSERWLGRPPFAEGIRRHWQRYEPIYEGVGREKALEHALTFELLDFSKVRRYCDVAAASSPIRYPLADDWDTVEAWRQDLLFETDLSERVVGGYAQSMESIEPGFSQPAQECSRSNGGQGGLRLGECIRGGRRRVCRRSGRWTAYPTFGKQTARRPWSPLSANRLTPASASPPAR